MSTVPTGASPKLLDRLRAAIRARHYSRRTEKAYVGWVRRYILFSRLQHPDDFDERQVLAFVTMLARDRRISASTQNDGLVQMMSAAFAGDPVNVATCSRENPLPGP
jgi:hypothetical protein